MENDTGAPSRPEKQERGKSELSDRPGVDGTPPRGRVRETGKPNSHAAEPQVLEAREQSVGPASSPRGRLDRTRRGKRRSELDAVTVTGSGRDSTNDR